MNQVITWLGKPVRLIAPAGNPLPRLTGSRGRFWYFHLLDGSDVDGGDPRYQQGHFAQEADLFITIEEAPDVVSL
jgi:hypothetical protein